MRVGWDLDGVVYPFVAALRTVVERRTRVRHRLPDPRQWDFWHDWGMTFQEWKDHFDAGTTDGSLFSWGGPLDHGIVNRMHETHSIHFITHRPADAHGTTRAWFRQHALKYDTLTFSDDKTVVEVDAYIDDKPENVAAVEATGAAAVLLDQPWNRGPESKGLHRVYSLREFRDFVKAVGG